MIYNKKYKKLYSPFGDKIVFGCGIGICETCIYDPYPELCSQKLLKQKSKRQIIELRIE